MSKIKMGNGKGMFMPEVTVEMFRNASLEAIEELMAEGEVFDIDLKETIHREKEQAYMKGYEDGRKAVKEWIEKWQDQKTEGEYSFELITDLLEDLADMRGKE